jgi:hypothetical protein
VLLQVDAPPSSFLKIRSRLRPSFKNSLISVSVHLFPVAYIRQLSVRDDVKLPQIFSTLIPSVRDDVKLPRLISTVFAGVRDDPKLTTLLATDGLVCVLRVQGDFKSIISSVHLTILLQTYFPVWETSTFLTYSSRFKIEMEAGCENYFMSIQGKENKEDSSGTPVWIYPEDDEPKESLQFIEDETITLDSSDDIILMSEDLESDSHEKKEPYAFTAYKRVDQKVKPVSGTFPEEARVRRTIPEDPLLSLPKLEACLPNLEDSPRMNKERLEILQINSTSFLWPEEEKLFAQVMWLNQLAIAFEEEERGTLKESYFSPYIIPTVAHTPWEYKNIPIPPGIRDKVIELLKLKINAGVYEPSQSAYRSRWFCVLKKNGKLRIVHDLQPLNKISIRDAGLPPILDDFIEPFAGRQCYMVFDLFWGFDARKVDPHSRDFTAFLTPLGLLRLTSLPMGYTNAPAEFQKCMSFILQEEIPDVANIFIDDLPIRGPATQYLNEEGIPEVLAENTGIRRFIWEHAKDVHRVMHRVKCAGGTFAAAKSQICKPEVVILGQKCTPEGRLPEDSKVSKILKWPPLTTPKEARAFLGLCGTVRIWIKNYSQLARPLTELWRQDVEFIWDQRRQNSFAKLKELVSSVPALHPIDYSSINPVILSVDSSNIATGMILSQIDGQGRRRPARYGSVPMEERESRYSQPKLELFGLYRALRTWRIHLIGVKTLHVEVDAQYIKGMLNEPDLQPNAAINRWIQGILMFDFTLIHVPATRFKGPDALSRRIPAEDEEIVADDDGWLDNIALFTWSLPKARHPNPQILPSVMALTKLDLQLQQIIHFLKTLELPTGLIKPQPRRRFIQKASRFFLQEPGGRLFRRNGSQPPLLVILDPERRVAIMTQAHEELGHKGVQSTWEKVRTRFYWPHLRSDVQHHCASCHPCQIRNTHKVQLPVTVSIPVTIFSKIYVDVMNMPISGGFKFIVAARDDLSLAAEGRALRANNATSLAAFFWEQIFCRYGAVAQVVTDNGPEIEGAFKELLKLYHIPQTRISPYNKQANGVVERGHFTIRESLMKACGDKPETWHKHVPLAFFADKVSTSRVTGCSPFYMLHGVHPVLPFDLTEATFMIQGYRQGISSTELLSLRIRQLQKRPEDLERAIQALTKARFRSKAQFERRFMRRIKREPLTIGDLVLIRNTRIEQEMNRKHKPRYLGPYVLREQRKSGTWAISDLDGTPIRTTVAGFRIYPYIARNPRLLQTLQEEEEGGDSEEEGEEELEEEEERDAWDSDNDMELDEDQEVDDQPWGLMVIPKEDDEETEDAILPIHPQFLPKIHTQEKSAEYRSYHMEKIKRMWLMDTETHLISHMAEVEGPQEHQDMHQDGTKKRKWKYPITTFYSLENPTPPRDPRLSGPRPSGPIFREKNFISIPLTIVWSKATPGDLVATGDS